MKTPYLATLLVLFVLASTGAETARVWSLEEAMSSMADKQVVHLQHRDSGTLKGHITACDLEQRRLQFRRLYQIDRRGQAYDFDELEGLSYERSSGLSAKWTAVGAGTGFALGGIVAWSMSDAATDGGEIVGAFVWLGSTIVGTVAGLVLPPILSRETVHCRFDGTDNSD